MISDADKDGNETIDFIEFCLVMNKKVKDEDREEELVKVFQTFAKPGKNYIDKRDLKDIFVQLGQDISIEDCKLLVEMNDSNDDGRLEYAEFVRFLLPM